MFDYLETFCLYMKDFIWERFFFCYVVLSWGIIKPNYFGGQRVQLTHVLVYAFLSWLDINLCLVPQENDNLTTSFACSLLASLHGRTVSPMMHQSAVSIQFNVFKSLHSIFPVETEKENQTSTSPIWVLVGSWSCCAAFIHKINVTASKLVPLLGAGDC